DAVDTTIQNNRIGTTTDGRTALGNRNDGINIGGTSRWTTVGDPRPGLGNVIAGNGANGVEFGVNAKDLDMATNFIGVWATGAAGNGVGVLLNGTHALIDGNVIGSNRAAGIQVNATASLIKITGNQIGVLSNANARPNGTDGIFVNGATSVTIGGGEDDSNVISGNAQNGIRLASVAAPPSAPLRIMSNYIGTE